MRKKSLLIIYLTDGQYLKSTENWEKNLNVKKTNDLNKKWGTKLNGEFQNKKTKYR